jgi:hypothetical protein
MGLLGFVVLVGLIITVLAGTLWTAPSATARATPGGIMLEQGLPTLITLAGDTDISFWEVSVTPPGIDGGDMVSLKTMHSVRWHGKAPRVLLEMTDLSITAGYDPGILSQIIALINVKTTVTVEFPEGTTWAAYGVLRVWEPQEITGDEDFPKANITISFTNRDPVTGAEEGPILVNVAGT